MALTYASSEPPTVMSSAESKATSPLAVAVGGSPPSPLLFPRAGQHSVSLVLILRNGILVLR